MIIGLCGAAGAGKNTVAERLCLEHKFVPLAFADPLYAAVSAITGLSVEQLQDRSRKENALGWISCSPRRLLQTLGTDWGRNMIHPEIWVMATMQRADAAGGDICITDVRFANEAAAIKARGGVVWRVVRPGFGVLDGEAAGHESERGVPLEYVDNEIVNASDIMSLWAGVDAAIRRLEAVTI
ncbi:MAG: adenylate kinase [Caulobacteraceae bacterium]|nr:adenylate kinase [Caulobacteraceae bacterium]